MASHDNHGPVSLESITTDSNAAQSDLARNNVSDNPVRSSIRDTGDLVDDAIPGKISKAIIEELCYGLIVGIRVRLHESLNPDTDLAANHIDLHDGSSLITLTMSFASDRCDFFTCSGQAAAVMNMKSFRSLLSIKNKYAIRLEAYVDPSSWSKPAGSSVKASESRYSSVDVLLFGSQSEADSVASMLAAQGFFLQDPDYIPTGFLYNNPQILKVDVYYQNGSDMDTHTIQKDLPATDLIFTQSDDFNLDFDRMLDNFACNNDLIQVCPVDQVATNLLSHQKEGLGFVLERESDCTLSSRTLWNECVAEGGSHFYEHVITGVKSRNVEECVGGIVADEMGLGKSLTMLSAIAGSQDRALAYACDMTCLGPTSQGVLAAKSTLVILPSALLVDSWIEEIHKHIIHGGLTYYKFHGQSRKKAFPHLLEYDIILTTYGTVAADYSRGCSLLHSISWYRIVLDEAHVIRNCATKQFRAVNALQSRIRWCLTGTPIQNSLDDLGSLVKFLKMPILEDGTIFKRHIMLPIHQNARGHSDYTNLRVLLNSICLRRTKAVLPIAQHTENIQYLDFNFEERINYSRLEVVCRQALDLAVSGHNVKEAHQNVLEALLRLRLFCNNGNITGKHTELSRNNMDPEEELSLLQQGGNSVCHYCSCDITSMEGYNSRDKPELSQCHRVICSDCVHRWRSEIESHTVCPLCEAPHSLDCATSKNSIKINSSTTYPSKMVAICQDIEVHKHGGKCVVFSFWRKSLDILGTLLQDRKIHFVRVDGSIPFSKRKAVLAEFQMKDDIAVILMTLGTGAVGLNSLSIANRIHLIEPQWNPSIENQAIGRVVRLGQQHPVTVVRYIMNQTVEKNVQTRQFRKLQLAHGGFWGAKSDNAKQRINMLRTLILTRGKEDTQSK